MRFSLAVLALGGAASAQVVAPAAYGYTYATPYANAIGNNLAAATSNLLTLPIALVGNTLLAGGQLLGLGVNTVAQAATGLVGATAGVANGLIGTTAGVANSLVGGLAAPLTGAVYAPAPYYATTVAAQKNRAQ